MSLLNTRPSVPNQDVYDSADPAQRSTIIKAGSEVSEVRFEDGAERNVPNDHLRVVEMLDSDRLAKPTEEEAIRRGQAAWDRLRGNSTFTDWIVVGAAHVLGRAAAMHEARTNKPQGRSYNVAFAAWARKFGFADLDKGDRARLFNVMDNRKEIDPWLKKLPLKERVRLNHPNSIWRRWKAATAVPDPNAPPKVPLVQKLNDSIASLQEENDRLKREIERGRQQPATKAPIADTNQTNSRENKANTHSYGNSEKGEQTNTTTDTVPPITPNIRPISRAEGSEIADLARGIRGLLSHPSQHMDAIQKKLARIIKVADPYAKARGMKAKTKSNAHMPCARQ
jgi:hypothetical protein